MLNGLIHLHSGFRWIVLLLLIAAIVTAFNGWRSKKAYSGSDLKIHKFTFISLHIQLLLGLIVYGMNWGKKVNFSAMSDKVTRFYTVEHFSMMLFAIIIASVGYIVSKKKTDDTARYKLVFFSYLVALLLILAAIPWPFGPWLVYGGKMG